MKTAALISIGNEILNGDIVDTNAEWLSKQLLSMNIPVVSSLTVGDEMDMIIRSLERASQDADIVLVTGGLGPTDDDITRNAIAEFLGVELEYKQELADFIVGYFKKRGVEPAEKNFVQAYLPAGARAIDNPLGTAPGVLFERDNLLIAAMPGVPSEMKAMFENTLMGEFSKLNGQQAIVVKKLKLIGMGESSIAEKLGDLMARGRNPLINCTVSCGIITLHIISKAKECEKALLAADKDEQKLRKLFADFIFGTDDDTLERVIGKKLAEKGQSLTIAESCTGGLIAKMITDVPGSSSYFKSGWVTYSNDAKNRELGVSSAIIDSCGAVSSEVAIEMARNARKKADSSYSIAVTGIAGPGGGTAQKPVGLVYIAIDSQDGTDVHEFNFSRTRDFIRLRTAQMALAMLYRKLTVD